MGLSANFLFKGTTVHVLALKVPWTSSFGAPVGASTNMIHAVVVENAHALTKLNNGHTSAVWYG